MKRILLLFGISLTGFSAFSQNPNIITTPFLSGLSNPLAIAHCGDSRVFIVQKNGIIRIADAITGALHPTAFLNIDPRVGSTGSEQGLLGMAFHPDYKNNGYFFLNYTNNSGNTTISRFSVDPADSNLALAGSEVILHLITQPFSNHNGGHLAFGPDGYLYIGMGDGGSGGDPQGNGQNPNVLLGKMLRIDVNHGDSSMVPATNPFINTIGYKPQIWHSGLRNPWRYSFDKKTGDMWMGDVGQNAREEINFQPAESTGGENWGWRCYEGNSAYNTTGCQPQSTYDPPIYQYSHTGGNCSVSGGYVYRGARYANLNGHYLFTDYCVPSLRTLKLTDTDTIYLLHSSMSGFIVGFGEDMYGELYAFNMSGGSIFRISDTSNCAPAVMISNRDTVQLCDTSGTISTAFYPGFIYAWYKDNTQLSFNDASIPVNADGNYSVTVFNPQNGCFNSDTVYVKMGNPATEIIWTTADTLYCTVPALTYTLQALPAGGNFYGIGVTDSLFNPAAVGALGSFLQEYRYTDTLGCTYSSIKKIRLATCVGVNETALNRFQLYPNPAKNEFSVSFEMESRQPLLLQIMDASGRLVQTEMMNAGMLTKTISVPGLEPGSYLVVISGDDYFHSQPLMIVR